MKKRRQESDERVLFEPDALTQCSSKPVVRDESDSKEPMEGDQRALGNVDMDMIVDEFEVQSDDDGRSETDRGMEPDEFIVDQDGESSADHQQIDPSTPL